MVKSYLEKSNSYLSSLKKHDGELYVVENKVFWEYEYNDNLM